MQDPAREEIPEKPSIELWHLSDFFSSVVSYFRPVFWDNYTASALEPQRPRNKFVNLLGFCCFQGFYLVIFALLGGLCLVIPGFLRLRFFCLQLRLRWLQAFTWLEAQPAMASLTSWVRYGVALVYSSIPRRPVRRSLASFLKPCYEVALLFFFFFTFLPRLVLLIVKYFFYLLVRGRWVILAL